MATLWTRNTDAEENWLEGHQIVFTTSKTHVEAGLAVSCPFCCLLQGQMLDDLKPKDEVYNDIEALLKETWAKGHRRAMWFGFDQSPPFGLARLYITEEGASWSDIGYQIYTTLGTARSFRFHSLHPLLTFDT